MTPAVKRPSLTDDSAAVRRIHEMFDTRELVGNESASEVQKMDDIFEPFRLSTARTKFNKIRSKNLGVLQKEVDDSTVFCRNSEFSPLLLQSIWEDEDSTVQFITLAIVLPSGIKVEQISSQVVSNGRKFEIIVEWPQPMMDVKFMHKAWLNKQFDPMKGYHPKVLGFQKALKSLRSSSVQTVTLTCRISSPFSVQTHIPKRQILSFSDGTNILYVDLKAPDDKYMKKEDIICIEVN
ncbi:unnamed protein product [Agarophyton chilense]